jgi:hypothetical protein
LQVIDLGADFPSVAQRQAADRIAGEVLPIDQGGKFADFAEREAELATSEYEVEALQIIVAIHFRSRFRKGRHQDSP